MPHIPDLPDTVEEDDDHPVWYLKYLTTKQGTMVNPELIPDANSDNYDLGEFIDLLNRVDQRGVLLSPKVVFCHPDGSTTVYERLRA